jgi:integrase
MTGWKKRRTRDIYQTPNGWGFDFTFKGIRHRQGGFFTKAQVEAALARKKTRLMDEDVGLVRPEAEEISFEKFGRQVLDTHSKIHKRSWKTDELHFKALKRFFKGKMLSDITAEQIANFRASRAAEVSNSTTNRDMSFLKMMLNLAVDWGKLEKSPAAKVKKLPEPPSIERILSADETQRLLAAAGPRLKPILVTALGTGMRRGELFALKWADIDFAHGTIHVRMSKSNKSRIIPVGPTVLAMLQALPCLSEFVFPGQRKGRALQSISRSFRTACADAKIGGFRFHDCRHTYATELLNRGVEIVTVSRILGHSSIMMTVKYLHTSAERLRLAAEKIEEFLDLNRGKVANVPGAETEFKPANHLETGR